MKKLIATATLALCLVACGPALHVQGVVVGKQFTPGSTSWGPVIGGKGGVVITSTEESYNLIVKLQDGTVHAIQVTAEEWAKYHEGSVVNIKDSWDGYEVE